MAVALFQDGGFYGELEHLSKATDLAEEFLGGLAPGEQSVFTVREAGRDVAVVTNRRIVGTFYKQILGGLKGDDCIACGEVEFDATDAILCMPFEEVLALEDDDVSTDAIGVAHVQWDGPHDVRMVDSICEFFGVESLAAITPEAFAFAVRRANPALPGKRTVRLSLELVVMVAPGANVSDFVRNVDYRVESTTPGVVVMSSTMKATDLGGWRGKENG